jgi:predicted nucleotide-binding protein
MVKKQASSDTIPPGMKLPVLTVSPKEASKLVNNRLISGKRILKKLWEKSPGMVYMASQELNRWDRYNSTLLNGMFTTPSFVSAYNKCRQPFDHIEARYLQDGLFLRLWLGRKLEELQSIKERLPLFDMAAKSSVAKAGMAKTFGKKVFVVHGHDKATKESVARFLERSGLNVVILHERPNKGRTIIEKLLEESDIDVGYAVVLLTPDDVGKLASEDGEASPRARQNVIFELGLFVAKLGRQRVHALYKEGVEIPTDYQGVLYTPLDDAEAWQVKLAMELKAVGFEIDLNKLITRD